MKYIICILCVFFIFVGVCRFYLAPTEEHEENSISYYVYNFPVYDSVSLLPELGSIFDIYSELFQEIASNCKAIFRDTVQNSSDLGEIDNSTDVFSFLSQFSNFFVRIYNIFILVYTLTFKVVYSLLKSIFVILKLIYNVLYGRSYSYSL